ncbi:V-type ATP synthase subunit A [Actinospica acidithermotolerans]|uniref:V-type ATP synthase subunit A n=1 Tax=Actinospica acidithermotolerans TaxID=2828514 RepID=UPI00355813FA
MTGAVRRVAGPLVELDGLPGAAMAELVLLGAAEIPGEVVSIRGGVLTVQAYEYTGGLAPGDPARSQGRPLSAALGPGLLGGVFDGLLRPLANTGIWLGAPAATPGPAAAERVWRFTPAAKPGDLVAPGHRLGSVAAARAVEHRILVPPGPDPGVTRRVDRIAPAGEYPADAVVAEVGGVPVAVTEHWPVRRPRPVARRVDANALLHTGQRALDLLFPIAKGGTAAVPGGFGTGKTVLLQQIAKWCDADVIVYVGCGERGNEMAEVVDELSRLEDPRTGGRLAERTVVIANTSNMPMMAREASVYTGVCVAEYFRDMGHDVVVIADSTSRWAEALREFASRSGALPAEEGFPANLASALAAFYERAGAVQTLGGERGSVTVIGAVSPPGGDLAEPVTVHTERVVRARWTLDRDLAYARHYPAVSWAESFSRDAAALAEDAAAPGGEDLSSLRNRLARILSRADRLVDLVDLVGIAALPPAERMDVLAGRLVREGVLQQSALSEADAHSPAAKTAALVEAVLDVIDACDRAAQTAGPAAVEGVDFGPLLRARDEAGPENLDAVFARRDRVLGALADLAGEAAR